MDFGGLRALDAVDLRGPPGRDRRPDRPQRRRQDHLLQLHHRHLRRRPTGDVVISPARAANSRRINGLQAQPGHGAGHGPDLPEHPPVPGDDGPGERHDRPPLPDQRRRPGRGPAAAARPGGRSRRSSTRATRLLEQDRPGRRRWTSWPRTSPTAPSAAWRSPGPWPPSPSCCCWTSRRPGMNPQETAGARRADRPDPRRGAGRRSC